MKAVLAALLIVSVAPLALAGDKPPFARFSKASPELRLFERSDTYEKGSFAHWKGKVELTGKLVLEFDRSPDDEPEPENAGTALFEPDTRSRAKLPAAINYYPLPVSTIELQKSPMEVLPALIGREKALQVVLSKKPRYELPVAVVLVSFSTSVECDHRSYWMEYSSIRLLRKEVVALAVGNGIGC